MIIAKIDPAQLYYQYTPTTAHAAEAARQKVSAPLQPREHSSAKPSGRDQTMRGGLAFRPLSAPAPEYTTKPDAQPNDSRVRCLQANIVSVNVGQGTQTVARTIHANQINITDLADKNRAYIAGQSPSHLRANVAADHVPDLFRACENMLLQGIESKQGVYQFVLRTTQRDPANSSEKPIIGQLLERFNASKANPATPLILGGRYVVTAVDRQIPRALSEAVNPNDHLHYHLDVIDLETGVKSTIALTQAGLKFTDKLLRPEEIARADTILDQHQALNYHSTAQQTQPMILSHAGIGRNATLITYREIKTRIADGSVSNETQLGAALDAVVRQGRLARGPNFIHSQGQLTAVREALQLVLDTKRTTPCALEGGNATEADLIAIYTAQSGSGAVRTAAGEAFTTQEFILQDNNGGGNCLFHALEGPRASPGKLGSLDMKAVASLRNEVAEVRVQMPMLDKAAQIRLEKGNYHDYQTIIRDSNPGELKGQLERGMVSNKQLAYMQRQPGYNAGDTEILQWISLARNHNRHVVVLDSFIGNESIATFRWDGARQTAIKSLTPLNNLGATKEAVRANIRTTLADAVNVLRHNTALEVANWVVLYRTAGHWQRVVGLPN